MRDVREAETDRANDVTKRPSIVWLLVAILVAAVGVSLSAVSATDQARHGELAKERAFERAATDIAGTLATTFQRESDLVVSTGAIYAGNPSMSSTDLATWLRSIRASQRHPELLAIAAMGVVSRAELPAFVDRLRNDPGFDLGPDDELAIVPAGERSSYCLLQAFVTLPEPETVPEPEVDYCASGIGPLLAAARDTGTPAYLALPSSVGTQLVVHAPVYRGGQDPGNVIDRRVAYVGSLGTALDPQVLFDAVLRDHPETAITVRYDGATSSTSFTSGDVPGARVIERDLGAGWTGTVAQPKWETGIWASPGAVQMLIAALFASAYGLLAGRAGMLSFGHAAYFGVGAFATVHAMNALGGAGLLPTPLMPLVGAGAPAVTPQQLTEVSVVVTGLRNAKGQVLACLTAQPKGFPDCRKDPAAKNAVVPAGTIETTLYIPAGDLDAVGTISSLANFTMSVGSKQYVEF